MRADTKTANLTRSRGIALIAGLLLMGSMVLLSLAIATSVLLERRAAAGFGDNQLAQNRAQLGLRWGEYWLFSLAEDPLDPACETECDSTPLFAQGLLPADPESQNIEWWKLNARVAGIEPISGQVRLDYTLPGVEDAFWLIEEVHSQALENVATGPGFLPPRLSYYRIFGHGSGKQPGSVAVTESIIARPWIGTLQPSRFPPTFDAPNFCDQVPEDVPCGRLAWRKRR